MDIDENPLAYLLTISLISSIVGASWLSFFLPKMKRFIYLQILTVPWISLIITSPIWGLIWSIHRWPPQGFSDTAVMWLFYKHDALLGLQAGWLSAIQSFPANVFGYFIFCMFLVIGKKLFSNS